MKRLGDVGKSLEHVNNNREMFGNGKCQGKFGKSSVNVWNSSRISEMSGKVKKCREMFGKGWGKARETLTKTQISSPSRRKLMNKIV